MKSLLKLVGSSTEASNSKSGIHTVNNNNNINQMDQTTKMATRKKRRGSNLFQSFLKTNHDKQTKAKTSTAAAAPLPKLSSVMGMVLGSGSFSHENGGIVVKLPKPTSVRSTCGSSRTVTSTTTSSDASLLNQSADQSQQPLSPPHRQMFLRQSSSFLRVADLGLDDLMFGGNNKDDAMSVASEETAISSSCSITTASPTSSGSSNAVVANFSYAAVDPPPGMDHNPRERWIVLDDGAGGHSPIAPLAVQALAKTGLDAALDQSMWTPHTSARYFKAAPWHTATWPPSTTISNADLLQAKQQEDLVLLWTGKFQHGLYGSELPAVRAAGIIPAAPKVLFDLLIDSNRVKEYNKMSLGREDLLVLQDTTDINGNSNNSEQEGPFGGKNVVTKVMRSKSSPPLVRQAMEFVSMLHAQELPDQSGYLIVTRAVTQPDDSNAHNDTSVLRSEILMGVNLIRRVDGDENRCVMINMIHMRSPMIPMIIANRIGASAAANFIRDLRAAFA